MSIKISEGLRILGFGPNEPAGIRHWAEQLLHRFVGDAESRWIYRDKPLRHSCTFRYGPRDITFVVILFPNSDTCEIWERAELEAVGTQLGSPATPTAEELAECERQGIDPEIFKHISQYAWDKSGRIIKELTGDKD